jgi:hypothetical protein
MASMRILRSWLTGDVALGRPTWGRFVFAWIGSGC